MNNKVPLFSKVCFLAVVPFLILTTLFSCNNVITDNPKNTPSVKPEKDKVVTITGFIRNPYEEAETGSRSAVPTSTFSNTSYSVTATAPGVSGTVTVSGTANATSFSIPLSLGKEWTINVEMEKKEEGDDEYKLVMTASGGFGHALTETDVTTPLTLVLEPLATENGTGKIDLSFSPTVETASLYDDVSIEIDDAAKRAVWNAAVTLHKDTGKISASSIKSGVYCVTINFYKDNVLVYSTTQSINVFNNMTTNRWVSSSTQNSPITTAGAFELTAGIIDHFRLTNYFIASTTSAIAGNDGNSGSPYAPLASIGEALRRIAVTGNGDAFTIRLMSDITENVTIPGTGTGGLNDKALSVTIKPLSGSVTVSGVAGAGKSVFNIATEIPVTFENLTITGGSAAGNGGGLNIGTDAEVTLKNCSVRENSVTGSSSLGGGIYNGGQLNVEGRISVTENTKGSGTGAVASNVYLPSGKKIGITGALNDTSTIGVTVCTESATSYPIVFTSGLGAHSSLANLSENSACEVFTSDEGYVFRVGTGMNGLEMVLLASEGGITNVFDDVVELSCDDAYVVPGSIITVAATVNGTPVPAKDTSWSFEITLSGEHIATLQGTSLIGYGSVKIPSDKVIFDDAKYMLHATVKVNGVGYDDCFMLLGKSDSLSAQGFVAVTGATVSGAVGSDDDDTASEVFIAGRTVTIPNLLVCDHEVTQAEYAAVMGENPSLLDGSSQLQPAENEKQKNRPVERVSWFKAIAYCNKRSSADGLTPCYTINGRTNPDDWGSVANSIDSLNAAVVCDFNADGYRLPTEAEWEYIARGGNGLTGTQYIYSGSDNASAVAWSSTDNRSDGMSHEVKIKLPNSLKIYDMSGNVWEWCWDRAVPGANDKPADITTDTPYTGSTTGDYRVCRGGSYYRGDDRCALTYRDSGGPLSSNYRAGGFRVVRTNKIPEELPSGTSGTAGTSATYMYFGEWPQTIKASGVEVNKSISKENGLFTYYYGSDGAWYVEQAEKASGTDYTYSDGTTVAQGGTSYKYFKVEPIMWRVLTTNYNGTGKKLLFAEKILANMYFYDSGQDHGMSVGVTVYANNYEHSRIRAYLNGIKYDANDDRNDFVGKGFLQTAFTSSAQSKIANTTVIVGDDAITNNNVFLLSLEEAQESAYGLNEDSSRIRDTTDFAKASGSSCNWWLRSPSNLSGKAKLIMANGEEEKDNVHNAQVGVLPAICIDN